MLTTAQALLIKEAINADPTLSSAPNNSDGAFTIAIALNTIASPAFVVWKTKVSIREVGDNFVGTELAGLTTGNQTRLQTVAVYSGEGVNPSLIDRRQFFDDIFSGAGGVATRAKLLALWKRNATRAEKALATGVGSDASPATMGYEGDISYQDVQQARNS